MKDDDVKDIPPESTATPDATTGDEGGGSDAEFDRDPTENTEAGEVRKKSPAREKREVG